MIELVSGLVIGGLAGVALKDKIVGSSSQSDAKQRELDELYSENEKFRKRNKEAERQIEDLFAQIDKLRRDSKNNEDAHEGEGGDREPHRGYVIGQCGKSRVLIAECGTHHPNDGGQDEALHH